MSLRCLAWVCWVGLTVLAMQPTMAAVVQHGSLIDATTPIVRLARADIETDLIFHSTALMPGVVGEAMCADRSLCQDGNELSGDTLLSAVTPPTGLFVSPTLMANAALLTLGLLWVMLTRRSLRMARGQSPRA